MTLRGTLYLLKIIVHLYSTVHALYLLGRIVGVTNLHWPRQ